MTPDSLEKSIFKARYRLESKSPFIAQLARYLKPCISDKVSTAGVSSNGDLIINREFAEKLSDDDMVWLLAHEVMHLVTSTHARTPIGVVHHIWNIASDIVINHIITDDMKLTIINPKVAVPFYGGEWSKYKDWTTEAVYRALIEDIEQTTGMSLAEFLENYSESGASGVGDKGKLKGNWWDAPEIPPGTGSDNEWKQRIASAAAAARQAGKLSGKLEQFVTSILAPKRDWRKELRTAARTNLKTQWTWRLPSRRTSGKVRTPGKERNAPTAICYIDTSGSMSNEQLQRCLSEICSIFRLCGGNGHLILGDCEIYFSGPMNASKLGALENVKRGGTDFNVLFKHIDETFVKKPSILIAFSDCEGPFPQSAPSYPVIWCQPADGAAPPWGRVIKISV